MMTHRCTRRMAFTLALCAAAAVPLAAQTAATATLPPINSASIVQGLTRWRLTALRDTMQRDLGVMTRELHFTSHDGQPAVLLVSTFPTPNGTILDSALAIRATLAPVWQHSHQPTKMLMLNFSASGVTGTITPADSAPRVVHSELGARVFDATWLGVLIPALPLAKGYTSLLPGYTVETGKIEFDTVAVTGASTLPVAGQPRPVWVVRYADPYIVNTYLVDQDTHVVRREEIHPRAGGSLLMVPVTAS